VVLDNYRRCPIEECALAHVFPAVVSMRDDACIEEDQQLGINGDGVAGTALVGHV